MSQPDQPASEPMREADSEVIPPLAPPDVFDPVIEVFKEKVDRTAIRENLRRIRAEQRAAPKQENVLRLNETYSEPVPLLAPPDVFDPVIEAYKKDVDRTLIRENLRRTPHERAVRMQEFIFFLEKWRGAAWKQNSVGPSTRGGE